MTLHPGFLIAFIVDLRYRLSSVKSAVTLFGNIPLDYVITLRFGVRFLDALRLLEMTVGRGLRSAVSTSWSLGRASAASGLAQGDSVGYMRTGIVCIYRG